MHFIGLFNKLHGLWNPEDQGFSNNPYPEPKQYTIPHIDTYLFKLHSNIVLESMARSP